MVSGRVIRYDSARGYGFIAPDQNQSGEDVFLHVNDMLMPESYVRQGITVEFEVEEGERGPKASSVRLPDGANAKKLPAPPVRTPDGLRHDDGEEPLCDVLSGDEYTRETTEVLLEAAPSLTGTQIVQIRTGLLRYAKGHGWSDG